MKSKWLLRALLLGLGLSCSMLLASVLHAGQEYSRYLIGAEVRHWWMPFVHDPVHYYLWPILVSVPLLHLFIYVKPLLGKVLSLPVIYVIAVIITLIPLREHRTEMSPLVYGVYEALSKRQRLDDLEAWANSEIAQAGEPDSALSGGVVPAWIRTIWVDQYSVSRHVFSNIKIADTKEETHVIIEFLTHMGNWAIDIYPYKTSSHHSLDKEGKAIPLRENIYLREFERAL